MKVIKNDIIPFRGFNAINLFGLLFARRGVMMSATLLNHERIHTAQMRELWYLPFYLLYFGEWLFRLTQPGNAYRRISFEREAYAHDQDLNYLLTRKRFASFEYWRKPKVAQAKAMKDESSEEDHRKKE